MASGDNDINICSRALMAIGANSITSFEEGTTEAQAANNKYETPKKDLLAIYRWTFNQNETFAARLNSDSLAIYKYLYELPLDCLRVMSVKEDGISQPYTWRNGKINTDAENPVITYCADVKEDIMPSYFVTVLIDRLARDLIIPVTGKHDEYRTFDAIYQSTLTTAKNIDAQSKTASRIKFFPALGVR